MDEDRIEQLAPELGHRAAARVDVEATATAVLERLREPVRVVWWRSTAFRVAAAVVLVLGTGVLVHDGSSRGDGERVVTAPVELRDLATTELAQVLDSLELARPVHELVPVGLDDLTESELQELLRTMEG